MNKIINLSKKISKKVVCLVIAIGMLLNILVFPLTTVFANTNTPKLVLQTDGSTIIIDDTDTNKLLYKQEDVVIGTVKVKLYNEDGDYITPAINNGNAEFELPECQDDGYQVIVEVSPEIGYDREGNYSFKGTSEPFPGDNIVHLHITDNSVQTMHFQFNQNGGGSGQNDSGQRITKMDFTINGETFTNVEFDDINKTIHVSNDFNMDTLEEFYVTRIELEDSTVYEYEPEEYSFELLDSENRTIFESHFDKISNNIARLRVEAHSDAILDKDIAEGKTRDDYYRFYITNIDFVKDGMKGVEVFTSVMPDNYDFTSWNGVDLSDTTKSNPGNVTVYYGEDTINFQSIASSEILEISLVDDGTVPSDAVEIDNSLEQIKILSNYYNNIPLQIKLEDGTIGYINISRIGIFINDLNAGSDTFYHGAFAMISGNFNVDTDKNRIAATFYHEDSTTYEDYDLIVNITYDDGSTETTIAKGVGDVHNSTGNIIGSDYLIWKDEGGERPSKVSVTAVKKGALADENAFGGATFGSGAGIEWEYRR